MELSLCRWLCFLVAYGFLPGLQMAAMAAEFRVSTGELKGIENTVVVRNVKEAYRSLGYELQLGQYPWKRSALVVSQGQADAELARIKSFGKLYPNLVMVPFPVAQIEVVVITASDINIRHWDELKAYRVGHVGGLLLAKERLKGHPNVSVVPGHEHLLKMLERGRIDVAVDARITAIEAIKSSGMDDIRVIDPPLETLDLYHFVNKQHKALVPRLAEIFRRFPSTEFGLVQEQTSE